MYFECAFSYTDADTNNCTFAVGFSDEVITPLIDSII